MTHQPLIVGQLNDGIEQRYPGTDVVRLSRYVQVILGVELDRRLSQQLPGWICIQGDVDTPNADKGIAIAPGLMSVVDIAWQPVNPWTKRPGNAALVVQANFLGTPLSLLTAHRPTSKQAQYLSGFDQALGAVIKAEKKAGRVPITGIDCNDFDPTALTEASDCTWASPYATCVCGLLLPSNVEQIGITWLSKTGEHPPVIDLLKVPVP